MGKTFWFWVVWFLFLFCLDFFIPFFMLKDIPKLTGSFLFWVIWVFVAIISMFVIFLRWQEKDER
jgi:drug/metabolite transporter (DMT)-like permease